ncbi:cytochrome P450 [Xylogone sp. PMI_703]|nr:cytochrome P450 [Xylogone sp. PMI_703]
MFTALAGLIFTFLVHQLVIAIYNAYFHPLSHLPGPKLYAASHIPHTIAGFKGDKTYLLHKLHEKYGEAVRYSPVHVSFTNAAAYKDILTNKPGRGNLKKDATVYQASPNGTHGILTTPSDADHSRYRRLLSHGFSEKAMREQEPLVMKYIDALIEGLRDSAKKGPQDMVAWYNWTTFDLIGDLTFGEPFGCLEKREYHPWIEFVFANVKAMVVAGNLELFPFLKRIMFWVFRKQIAAKMEENARFTAQKVARRMEIESGRSDFLGYILRHKGKETEMSLPEIEATSTILVLGGSETTATLLSGATYLLLNHPEVLERLKAEVRGHFYKEDDINMVSVNALQYMLAVLDEAMRIFPPVTIGSLRNTPPQGDTISGYFIPGGARVIANHYASTHSAQNWKDPDSFVPERWLGDPRYAGDARGASQPFSMGPRNCIGRNLAYAEMRVILARVIWNFDMELADANDQWMKTLKIYSLWEKTPLMVKLTSVRG